MFLKSYEFGQHLFSLPVTFPTLKILQIKMEDYVKVFTCQFLLKIELYLLSCKLIPHLYHIGIFTKTVKNGNTLEKFTCKILNP